MFFKKSPKVLTKPQERSVCLDSLSECSRLLVGLLFTVRVLRHGGSLLHVKLFYRIVSYCWSWCLPTGNL